MEEALPFHPHVMPWPEDFVAPPPRLSEQEEEDDEEVQQQLSAQWVAAVPRCSSEFGEQQQQWTGDCIVGPPGVAIYGDHPEAWAPAEWGTAYEWVELQLAVPCQIQQIRIYESFTPGALWRVQLWQNDRFVLVHEQNPRCGQYPPQLRVEQVRIAPDRQLVSDRIKLEFDQRGGLDWYEIDAVQVLGRPLLDGDDVAASGNNNKNNHNDKIARLAIPAALATILGDAMTADCTLVVSSGRGSQQERHGSAAAETAAAAAVRIPVHRGILAARSPVFRAMIQRNEMPLGGEANLTDIHPKLIQLLLEWIYTGRILQFDPLDCVSLLVVADYFQVDSSLTEFCTAQFTQRMLTVDNAARLFAYHDAVVGSYVPPVLRQAALAFCGQHFAAVAQTPSFSDLTHSQLLAVIDIYHHHQRNQQQPQQPQQP
jgi:BTB/POZ domain